jgi:hypothetical protein
MQRATHAEVELSGHSGALLPSLRSADTADFFLRRAKSGHNLISMVASGLNHQNAAAVQAAGKHWFRPKRLQSRRASDTLHSSSEVAGSPARFDGSVWAIPLNRSRSFILSPDQGTADTLLLR